MPAAPRKVCQSELSKHLITKPETEDRILLSISKLFSVALEFLQAVDSLGAVWMPSFLHECKNDVWHRIRMDSCEDHVWTGDRKRTNCVFCFIGQINHLQRTQKFKGWWLKGKERGTVFSPATNAPSTPPLQSTWQNKTNWTSKEIFYSI